MMRSINESPYTSKCSILLFPRPAVYAHTDFFFHLILSPCSLQFLPCCIKHLPGPLISAAFCTGHNAFFMKFAVFAKVLPEALFYHCLFEGLVLTGIFNYLLLYDCAKLFPIF